MRFEKLLLALFSLLCWHSLVFAQSANGKISGLVLDPTSGAIPGADVLVINDVTHIKTSTRTNAEGIYALPNLPPGSYRLQVSKTGFKTLIKPDIVLNVQDALSVNFTLPIGAVSETVTVEGGTSMVNTTDASVSTVIDRHFVENMPLNGRSFQSLMTLTPGVVLTKAKAGEQGQFSVNGQRADANYFTIDGVSANIGSDNNTSVGQNGAGALPAFSALGGTNNLVSVDALQEFRVQTSTYAPEFGRTPGGQVEIVTRSGTNEFHGTAFEYLRNDSLDANDWFADRNGLPKPAERQNDFGGVLGGPVQIPGVYRGKNRTFFFFSYEGLRLREPQTKLTSVPSMAARQIAPPSVQPFLNAYPFPNGKDLGGGLAEFSGSYSNPSTLNATSLRLDHTFTGNLTFFARYNHAPSESIQRGSAGQSVALSNLSDVHVKTQTLTSGLVWSISPTASNDLRINWSRNIAGNFLLLDSFGGAIPPADSVLFSSFVSRANSANLFLLLGGPNTVLNVGNQASNSQRQINIVDGSTFIAGTHQLKVGVDYRRLLPTYAPENYALTEVFNGVNGALTGKTLFTLVTSLKGPLFPVFNNFSLFAQDTWKVRSPLTLTYGVRWEFNPPPSERNGNHPFAVTGLDTPATLALATKGTSLYQTTFKNFAPRLGASYLLSKLPGKETVVRIGAGFFYDLGYGQTSNAFVGFPNRTDKQLFGVSLPLTTDQLTPAPFSLTPPFGAIVVADPNLKTPLTYQWSLTSEQSLGPEQVISLSYLGSSGHHLLRQETLSNPNPNFTTVNATRSIAGSNYNAIQFKYQRRLLDGLQALASYTWSHSIDNVSNDSSALVPIKSLEPRVDRSSSDFDVRHSLTGALTYNVPELRLPAIVNCLLIHWSLDTGVSVRSATPVNVITGKTIAGVSGVQRPDLVPGSALYKDDPNLPGGLTINSNAFVTPPTTRQGTLGRNALRGFGLAQWDFSLRRQFNLTERLGLQWKAEFFNVLNHPNFADPNNSLTDPFFGQSTQMLGQSLGSGGFGGGFNSRYQVGGPRSIQFALRLQF